MAVKRPLDPNTTTAQKRVGEIYEELSSLKVDLERLSDTVPAEFQSVIQPMIELIEGSIDRGLSLVANEGKGLVDASTDELEKFGLVLIQLKDKLQRLAIIGNYTYSLYCHTLGVRQRLFNQQQQPID